MLSDQIKMMSDEEFLTWFMDKYESQPIKYCTPSAWHRYDAMIFEENYAALLVQQYILDILFKRSFPESY